MKRPELVRKSLNWFVMKTFHFVCRPDGMSSAADGAKTAVEDEQEKDSLLLLFLLFLFQPPLLPS